MPKSVEIIGTHPLFVPGSTKNNSLKGCKITICNIRSTKIDIIEKFCKEKLHLKFFQVTPEEHDFQMAISQGLTHCIARISKNIGLDRVELSTKTFDNLMNTIEILEEDSEELFEDMQKLNPYSKEVRSIFLESAKKIDLNLK